MSKPRPVTAAHLSPMPIVPNPPDSYAAVAATRRRSSRNIVLSDGQVLPASLIAARRMSQCVFTASASAMWPSSLRATDYILASGCCSRQRRMCNAASVSSKQVRSSKRSSASVPTLLSAPVGDAVHEGVCVVSDENSNLLKEGSRDTVPHLPLNGCPSEGLQPSPNRLGSMQHLRIHTSAIDESERYAFQSPCLETPRFSHLPIRTCMALDTLRLLFLPLWRRHRFHKQITWAKSIVAKYTLVKVHCRRKHRADRNAEVTRFLRGRKTKLRCTANVLEMRVVCIQRAYRRFRVCVHAVVELNYRNLRRYFEEAYWDSIVAQRESELAMRTHTFRSVTEDCQEMTDADIDIQTSPGLTARRTNLGLGASSKLMLVPARYELDVYNFAMVGRLPESILRSETSSAVFAHLRRSAARACFMDDFSRTRACCADSEGLWEADVITSTRAPPVRTKGRSRGRMPHFLPKSAYVSILNNTCYLTSLMRGDERLRAHLSLREHNLEPY